MIYAALGVFSSALIMGLAYALKKIGKLEVQIETLEKAKMVSKAQLDIASRPADTADDVDQWLRK